MLCVTLALIRFHCIFKKYFHHLHYCQHITRSKKTRKVMTIKIHLKGKVKEHMITSVVSVANLNLDQSETAQQRFGTLKKKKRKKKSKWSQNWLCSLQSEDFHRRKTEVKTCLGQKQIVKLPIRKQSYHWQC